MFTRTLSLFLALFIALSGLLYTRCLRIQTEDRIAYQKLFETKAPVRWKQTFKDHPVRQKRHQVQKDVWAMQGAHRHHFRLTSQDSDWIISQQKGKMIAVEEMHQLVGWIQDEVDDEQGQQLVRSFQADRGTYVFPSHRFIADTVDLAFFRLPGTELPSSPIYEKPFLKGKAYDLNFTAFQKIPALQATHLQLEFDPAIYRKDMSRTKKP